MKAEDKTKEQLMSQDVIKGGKIKKTEKVIHKREKEPSEGLVVVGIGASAGGLEALRVLLAGLPSKANIAYIIAQHLDPKHRSMLTSLLSPCTSVGVLDARDKQIIRPNRIYVAPPAKEVTISKGQIRLTNPTASVVGPKASIDHFLASLAKYKGDKAVGIILSGTGSDGAHGMRAIKAEGGITIVQDEATAKYSGMPHAAMETGIIDLILPPEKIGLELVDLLKQPRVLPMARPDKDLPNSLQRIFQLLLDRTGCDFSDYKLSTIHRRIGRRMAVHKLATTEDYVHCLEKSDSEIDLLFKDIVVCVTSFFRDPQAFQALGNVLPKVIADKKPKDNIRIWVPGCATGEEAYSIAMLLVEELGDRINGFNVQIFATDIDSDAITTARKGVYPEAAVLSVDKLILQRYFTHEDGVFRVAKALRELVVFAKQDLTGDPPFSRLDLVSCRNLLIYFNAALQKKLIPTFHHVLNPNGYLFLGKSESVGQFDNLFVPVDKKWRIFLRRDTLRAPALDFRRIRLPAPQMGQLQKPVAREIHLKDVMNEAIADTYGHSAAIIDDRLEIVFVRGDVSPYLSLTPGGVDLNILTMARSELRADLRVLIHRSTRDNSEVCSRKLRIKVDDQVRMATLRVRPTTMDAGATQLTLVLFEEETVDETAILPIPADGEKDIDPCIAELEHELAVSREHINTTVEELETASEELQSMNEELQSTNEELQSTNEELLTSNEELQSTNEELTTLNEELNTKSAEVTATNTDLENILKRVGIALVTVDNDLKVSRFTPPARKIFALTAKDEGQVLTTIACHINLPDLRQRLLNVIRRAKTFEAEIEAENLVYWMRILPYYSEQNQIAGAVLIFLDQTDIRQAENKLRRRNEELKDEREYAESIVATVREPLLVLDADLMVVSASRSFYQTFNVTPEETQGRVLYDLGNRQWDIPRLRELLEQIPPKNTTFDGFEMEHDFPTIGRRAMLLNARQIYQEANRTRMILLAFEDITKIKRVEEELRKHRGHLEELVKGRTKELEDAQKELARKEKLAVLGQLAGGVSHELRNTLGAIKGAAYFLNLALEAPEPEVKETLDILDKEVALSERIISSLLDFAQARPPTRRKAEINELVQGALSAATVPENVQVVSQLDEALPTMWADPDQLVQAFGNIILNGIQAMPDGGRLVIKSEAPGPGWVAVSVTDTGAGIPEENLGKLFEPLFTTKAKGIGLGLAVVKTMVEGHGGTVEVQSEVGQGTTFTVVLPLGLREED